ncbi:MAG: anti-sigma factor family protein [Gemmatimonadaceae bacterium]|jgi:anti-sigma factor RsiW
MTDRGLDTVVAGVRCREVLADLSDYLDGALTPARVRELQAHLGACDRCARFGGQVAAVLQQLREAAVVESPVDVVDAVLARIAAER